MPFAGTQQVDLSALVNVVQQGNTILNAILSLLTSGVVIQPKLTVYPTVAGLPTVGIAVGQIGYVSNGRKPAEGPGAGTGVPIWFNVSGVWFAMTSGLAVTA